MVTLSRTTLYEALPQGQLAVIPEASHALPIEQPDVLASLIIGFLTTTEPPHTLIPVCRVA